MNHTENIKTISNPETDRVDKDHSGIDNQAVKAGRTQIHDPLKQLIQKRYGIKTTDKEILSKWFHLLVLGRALDNRAPNYLKQAIGWSYHAPYAGHDGIQLAIGQVFDRNTDHLFPYYRDMLTSISAGLTAEEIIYNGISKATDVAGAGRHMSNHFAKPEWHIDNVSSATGNHALHAVGVGRAMKRYKHQRSFHLFSGRIFSI